MLVHAPDAVKRRFDHVVEAATGGAAPPSAVIEAMERMGFRVTHLYGLTESYGPSTVCAWQEEWDALPPGERAGHMARQGVQYLTLDRQRVADPESMRDVPADGATIGELMLRSNTLMKGYLANPAATEEAFAGGWFHTGDLAVCQGRLHRSDRSKDIIIPGRREYLFDEVRRCCTPSDGRGSCRRRFRTHGRDAPAPLSRRRMVPGGRGGRHHPWCRANLAHPCRKPSSRPLPKTSTGKIQNVDARARRRHREERAYPHPTLPLAGRARGAAARRLAPAAPRSGPPASGEGWGGGRSWGKAGGPRSCRTDIAGEVAFIGASSDRAAFCRGAGLAGAKVALAAPHRLARRVGARDRRTRRATPGAARDVTKQPSRRDRHGRGAARAVVIRQQCWRRRDEAAVRAHRRGLGPCRHSERCLDGGAAIAHHLVGPKRPGRIINIASVLGLRTIGRVPAYCTAKAGLIHLNHVLAMELARYGILVNALAPGYVETDFNREFFQTQAGQNLINRIPLKRIAQAPDLDGALLFLASPASAYVTGAVISMVLRCRDLETRIREARDRPLSALQGRGRDPSPAHPRCRPQARVSARAERGDGRVRGGTASALESALTPTPSRWGRGGGTGTFPGRGERREQR
jgi:NAD(P)-dependent dehydrogenase (short-subunit alcohol dehydrogenase family)